MIKPKNILFAWFWLTCALTHAQLTMPRATSTYWRDFVPTAMRQSYISYGAQYIGQPWATIPDSIFGEFRRNAIERITNSFAFRNELNSQP